MDVAAHPMPRCLELGCRDEACDPSRRDCRTYSSSRRRHASTTRVALTAVRPISGKVSRLGRRRSSDGSVRAALKASTPSRFETTKNTVQRARRMRKFPFVKFLAERTLPLYGIVLPPPSANWKLAWPSLWTEEHEPLRIVRSAALGRRGPLPASSLRLR